MIEGRWIWRGLSGRSYGFSYAPVAAPPAASAAVYLLAAHGGGLPRALYVGDGEDVAATLAAPASLLAAAHRLGMTHVHILAVGAMERARIRADLIHGLRPPLRGDAARVLPADRAQAASLPTDRPGPGWGTEMLLSGGLAALPIKH